MRTAFLLLALGLATGLCWGAAGNLLPNPSFESGATAPDGWRGYGLEPHRWEYVAPDGDRCLSISGDGLYANGWYAHRWTRPALNQTYHLACLARKQDDLNPLRRPADTKPGVATMGLKRVRWNLPVTDEWKRYGAHFRSPDALADTRCELGQQGIAGTVSFDCVALYPSIAVYRCAGLGRYGLGDGETIVERKYTATQPFGGPHTNDCRFLRSYTAQYVHDRWVLDGTDLVTYAHQIPIVGAPQMEPGMVDPKGILGERFTKTDPDALRFVSQEASRVALDVARCQGTLLVEVGMGPNGPWHPLGTIERPGTYSYTVPWRWQSFRAPSIRLQSLWAKCVEVTKYEYTSLVITQQQREPLIGATTYLDVLTQSPELGFRVLDVGDHVPGGRNFVTLSLTNKLTERRALASDLIVKRGDTVVSTAREEFLLGPSADKLPQLSYTVDEPGDYRLELTVSDMATGQPLLTLEGGFAVPALGKPEIPTPPLAAPTPPA
jgi:hypothetical protein